MKYFLFTSMMLVFSVISIGQQNQPVANPKVIAQAGNARFTVLTPELIRMEWSSDKKFTDDASQVFINRNLPVPAFRQEINIKKQSVIMIRPMAGSKSNEHLREGHRGFVSRMKFAMEMIKFEISAVDWGAAIPDLILNVESLPVRINYYPEKAIEYLLENETNKNHLRDVIMGIRDVKKENLQKICDYLELN